MGFGITFIPQNENNEDQTYFKIEIIPLTCKHSTLSEMMVTEKKSVCNKKMGARKVIFNTLLSITY